MTRTFIATDEPLGPEDPSLAWLRRVHPEVLKARERPHEFAPQLIEVLGGRTVEGIGCRLCWASRRQPWHRGGGAK